MASHPDDPARTQPSGADAASAAIDALGRSFYRELLDHIDDCVRFVDRKRRLLFWNRAAERLTGFASGEVVGRRCPDNILCHADETGRVLCSEGCLLEQVMSNGVPAEKDIYLHHKDGQRIPVRVKATPIRDGDGRVVGAVEVFNDRAARMDQAERIRELERLALIDELTRLPNRRHFDIQLRNRLAELQRHGWPFGLLLIDVDMFKPVNDRHGHEVGDRILKLVARTLDANCRVFDLVARWGGEEFAAIVANVDAGELKLVAEKLRAMVAASHLRTPAERGLGVTVSMGATLARREDSAESLLKRADALLYRAKNAGRNQVCMG
jgi:diguanylate cyclase (GGDEF)-like protein/PAS domain S-box-containing protein